MDFSHWKHCLSLYWRKCIIWAVDDLLSVKKSTKLWVTVIYHTYSWVHNHQKADSLCRGVKANDRYHSDIRISWFFKQAKIRTITMQTNHIKECTIWPEVFFIPDWTKHQKISKFQFFDVQCSIWPHMDSIWLQVQFHMLYWKSQNLVHKVHF